MTAAQTDQGGCLFAALDSLGRLRDAAEWMAGGDVPLDAAALRGHVDGAEQIVREWASRRPVGDAPIDEPDAGEHPGLVVLRGGKAGAR